MARYFKEIDGIYYMDLNDRLIFIGDDDMINPPIEVKCFVARLSDIYAD